MPCSFKPVCAVLCLVFGLCFVAPDAHADQFVYTYTVTSPSATTFSWETVPIPGVTGEVDLTAASLANTTVTGSVLPPSICPITGASLDVGGAGNQETDFGAGCGVLLVLDQFFLPAADYTTPGTYFFTSSDSHLFAQSAELNVRDVTTATPEPSAIALMLAGAGLVSARRKRRTSGLQPAS